MKRELNISDLEFDKTKVLNWWTGRISNMELGEWTGQTERDVRFILASDYFADQISGGGRGSKTTRRISRQARNAVAIIAALRNTGLSIELSSMILSATPVIASAPTEVVDFSPGMLAGVPEYSGVAMLAVDDPNGGWRMADHVPSHVFNRKCRPLIKRDQGEVTSLGDIVWLPDWSEARIGQIPDSLRSIGEQMYRPEIDPFGFYEFGNHRPDSHPRLDSHIFIIDGRWVFERHQHIDPREYLSDVLEAAELFMPRRYSNEHDPEFHYTLMSEISDDKKEVVSRFGDEEKEALARKSLLDFSSSVDINSTVAVRKMKRRALGRIGVQG